MSLTDWSLALSGFGSKGNAFVSLSLLGTTTIETVCYVKICFGNRREPIKFKGL